MKTTPYNDFIRTRLSKMGHVGVNPNWVEAFMRLEHPTLDGLSSRQFDAEIRIAVECIQLGGEDTARACAESFAL